MFIEHEEFLVIGDIEGRIKPLMSLIERKPDIPVISVGDAHDRGKDNKAVFELFMTRKNYYMTQSNHTHMLLDFYDGCKRPASYDGVGWVQSGGKTVLFEYGVDPFAIEQMLIDYTTIFHSFTNDPIEKQKLRDIFAKSREEVIQQFRAKIEPETIEFLRTLPYYIETKDVIITHAPLNPILKFDLSSYKRKENFLWNRGNTRRDDRFQIHGHISMKKPTFLQDKNGIYGINIDSSVLSLSAFHWPSREIFSEELEETKMYKPIRLGTK